MFVTRVLRSLGRSLLSARGIFPHKKWWLHSGVISISIFFLVWSFQPAAEALLECLESLKFLILGWIWFFFLEFPCCAHLPFSNRAHVHWLTPDLVYMLGTFEKITCFLFKSKIFVFSCCFTPVRTFFWVFSCLI